MNLFILLCSICAHNTIISLIFQVCTTGYIASLPIKEMNSKYGLAVKRLLFTDYLRSGKGLAVLLVFKSPKNVEVRRERERERNDTV